MFLESIIVIIVWECVRWVIITRHSTKKDIIVYFIWNILEYFMWVFSEQEPLFNFVGKTCCGQMMGSMKWSTDATLLHYLRKGSWVHIPSFVSSKSCWDMIFLSASWIAIQRQWRDLQINYLKYLLYHISYLIYLPEIIQNNVWNNK